MATEREVITLAFGNYSSLVAAQWANGTSHYDAHHSTLYSECRRADVVGGSGGADAGVDGRARVPRLLLFDAPYSSAFDDVAAWERRYAEDIAQSHGADDEDDNGRAVANASSAVASALSAPRGGTAERESDVCGSSSSNYIASVAAFVQRRVVEQHGLDEGDDEEDDDADGDAQELLSDADSDADAREADDQDETRTRNAAGAAQRRAHRRARLRRHLFDHRNRTVPWWQYITTGLGPHSVTSMRPLQHVDAAGDLPALHSFGYGLAHLRDDGRSGEMADVADALRRQLEAADHVQGVQCFTDGDGIFGGAAANVLEQLWDDAGSKTPVVHACSFTRLPDVVTDPAYRTEVAFRERRLDEAALNELLATLHLSRHPSAVYIPLPLAEWDVFFKGAATAASPAVAPQWLQDAPATAQLLAAVMDTALYGLRDGGGGGGGTSPGPQCSMGEWCRIVRPAPSLRVAAAMGALPLPVSASSELWDFLQRHPLLPDAPLLDARMRHARPTHEDGDDEEAAAAAGTGAAAATRRRAKFFSLTHSMSTYSPEAAAGQVLGHAVCLRGAGVLPATVYPAREAMLRYALPLRTSTYLPLLTEVSYPLSRTFPMELLFADPVTTAGALGGGDGNSSSRSGPPGGGGTPGDGGEAAAAALRRTLQSVAVGAHVLSTYASAPMLRGIAVKAQAALRYKLDRYSDAYSMEKDDWREALDEAATLFDDYHHAPPSDGEDDEYVGDDGGGGDDYT
ncbi:Tubulin/FtsZ family [Novymonas esmeraldas]|uniref:Tubulin/FtsZ family n=1 Tax=Novymonas esmeraldas TaxID=1808958 RepID=A0AAW0FCN1_9TRYP